MKKLLYNRESACVQPVRELIEQQKHRTLVIWSIEYAPRVLTVFEERHPGDLRPRAALEAAHLWARGEIKMPAAQRAALASHRAATVVERDPAACAAARAMGHVVGTVHVETHAMGLVLYGLTAIFHEAGPDGAEAAVAEECRRMCERLQYWEETVDTMDIRWAPFLLRDDVPNKERLLRQKTEAKRARDHAE